MDGSIPGWKPGLYYGADEQCKIAFGSIATACTFADSNVVGRKFLSCWGQWGDVLELRCKERELETLLLPREWRYFSASDFLAKSKRFLKCFYSFHRWPSSLLGSCGDIWDMYHLNWALFVMVLSVDQPEWLIEFLVFLATPGHM